MSLSVIIISKNEALNIGDCLKSVAFATERILVDSGSTDGTIEIAQEMKAQVHVNEKWPGFGPQKNLALDKATGDWVLSLDSDERVDANLREEILRVITSENALDAYELPRLTNFCGRWVYHCGWYPDYHVRLFKRSAGRFTDDLVHESIKIPSGRIGKLTNRLIHYSFRTHEDCLRKMSQYSILGATQAASKGKRPSLFKAVAFAAIDFSRTYFMKLGFLDGKTGLIIAIMSAEAMYQKYLGLYLNSLEKDLTLPAVRKAKP